MIYTLTLNPSIDYVINLDEVKLGELNRIQADHFFTGGKGINVSRVLKNLGHANTALGFMGGFTGDFVAGELAKENIQTDFTAIEEYTRINIKVKAAEETELNGQGPRIDEAAATKLLDQLAAVQPDDLVIISGSQPPNLPADYYQQIIAAIKEAGAEFVIDTTGKALEDALASKPFLVKPNDVELAELFNVTLKTEADYMKYGQKLIEAGARFAIVSLGSKGALLFSDEGIFRGNSPKGTVKNTVGAGDSMIAGFVGTFLETEDLQEAFKIGLASGGATAFTEDLATKEEIETLYPQIQIEKIGEDE